MSTDVLQVCAMASDLAPGAARTHASPGAHVSRMRGLKRRTRRRIVRTLITSTVVGLIVLLACWHRREVPANEASMTAALARSRQLAACQDQIRPRLSGPIDAWRIAEEQANAEGRRFTFAANFNEKTAFYHCDVDASGAVRKVDGPE